jgi:RNA-splicing ligase RtcB
LKIANYWQRKAGKQELSFLEGEDVIGYLTDMHFAQTYAKINRNIILHKIAMLLFNDEKVASAITSNSIETVHNYINFNDFVIRKGAISSYKGEYMIIPFNMEDGVLICEGKSNPEWNFSAPHGAGRVGSRAWAKENLSLTEAETRMKEKGIYTSCLPIDELKGAYKDPEVIEKAIEPTATIIDRLKPILNMKTK